MSYYLKNKLLSFIFFLKKVNLLYYTKLQLHLFYCIICCYEINKLPTSKKNGVHINIINIIYVSFFLQYYIRVIINKHCLNFNFYDLYVFL